jgi:DNA ligase-1
MNIFQPMLAAPLLPPSVEHTDGNILEAMSKLKYPVMATVKMDGIRALVLDMPCGKSLVSRRLKLIPREDLQRNAMIIPIGFDMEIWYPETEFCDITSAVMSEYPENPCNLEFHVLDWFMDAPYNDRMSALFDYFLVSNLSWLKCEQPVTCYNHKQLFAFEKRIIETGEGICFRAPDSPYKQGRSTLKEQYLVKLARFVYSEVKVINFIEKMHNLCPEKRDGTGHMNRSTSKDFDIGAGTLGAFEVEDENGLRFKIGTGSGLNDNLRDKIWRNQDKYFGKTLRIKSKAHGKKIKPRNPCYAGFRED